MSFLKICFLIYQTMLFDITIAILFSINKTFYMVGTFGMYMVGTSSDIWLTRKTVQRVPTIKIIVMIHKHSGKYCYYMRSHSTAVRFSGLHAVIYLGQVLLIINAIVL